jgi:hypothetical protein
MIIRFLYEYCIEGMSIYKIGLLIISKREMPKTLDRVGLN